MRMLITFSATFFFLTAFAQKKELRFDNDFKPTTGKDARYAAVTELRDSLWYTKAWYLLGDLPAMTGSFKDAENMIPHGEFFYYEYNGLVKMQGRYRDGKREGVWITRNMFNKTVDSLTYSNGYLSGPQFMTGINRSDSAWFDGKGNGQVRSRYQNKTLRVQGMIVNDTSKQGEWKYFDSTGKPLAVEQYDNGKLLSLYCFDSEGNRKDSSACAERDAKFQNGKSDWIKYLSKNLNTDVPAKNKAKPGKYSVIVSFKIDKEGRVVDIYPLTNHGRGMEQELVRVLQSSPKWEPAYIFGRPVNAYKTQPITFIVPE
jgi:antitoxin component YwqK of YwqJK toxin-antitoxin module